MAALDRLDIISRIVGKATPKLAKYLAVDDSFLLQLVAEEVIEDDDKETIRNLSTTSKQVEKVCTIIKKRLDAYDGFMKILKCSKNKDLYEMMKNLEVKEGLDPSPPVPGPSPSVPDPSPPVSGPSPPFPDTDVDLEADGSGFFKQRIKPAPSPTDVQRNEELCYTSMLHSPKKGLAYILNNSKTRKGSEEDYKNMVHLYGELGYEIYEHKDLSAEEIYTTIDDFVGRFTNEHASSVVVLMSHGDEGIIQGEDKKCVQLKKIYNKFKTCGPLSGKPKLFFIQACRGGRAQPAANSIEGDSLQVDTTVPQDADIYIAFATTEGYFAVRNTETGSWFVNAIVAVFLASAHKYNLDTLMNLVNSKVTKKVAKLHGTEARQVAEVHKTTIKQIFFHPKGI